MQGHSLLSMNSTSASSSSKSSIFSYLHRQQHIRSGSHTWSLEQSLGAGAAADCCQASG